jgi:hypothetical protein
MYISLRESCANGFKRWSNSHQPKDGDDRDPSEASSGVIPSPDFVESDTESPQVDHRLFDRGVD